MFKFKKDRARNVKKEAECIKSREIDPLDPIDREKLTESRKPIASITYRDVAKPIKDIIKREFTDSFLITVYKETVLSDLYVHINRKECALTAANAADLKARYSAGNHVYNDNRDLMNTILINMKYNYNEIVNYYCGDMPGEPYNHLFKTGDDFKNSLPKGLGTYESYPEYCFQMLGFHVIPLNKICYYKDPLMLHQ